MSTHSTTEGTRTFPTIAATELERLGVGKLIDVLVWLYDAGWMAGAGQPVPLPPNKQLAALLEDVRDAHQSACDRLMDFIEPDPDRADELPTWLLDLPQSNIDYPTPDLSFLPFDDTPTPPGPIVSHGIAPLPPLGGQVRGILKGHIR